MKNLKTYDQFLFEDMPSFGYDGCQLQVGKSVISRDGFSGIIVSKESVNGKVQYRDHNGIIRICESYCLFDSEFDEYINEGSLKWWEAIKGLFTVDALKTGLNVAGGAIQIAGYIFPEWKQSLFDKIEIVRRNPLYSKHLDKIFNIADVIENDPELKDKLKELVNIPIKDRYFATSKREEKKAIDYRNRKKSKLKDIAIRMNDILDGESKKLLSDINQILKTKPID